MDFTRSANQAKDRVETLILRSDTRWTWDDSNNSSLPIGTQNLIASQEDYAVPATDLKILKVRIKDSAGNLVTLDPVNRRDLTDAQLTATAGDPKRYFKIGRSVFLNPKPSYASTAGFEVQFQRSGTAFTIADTTAVPGFDSNFHRLISLYSALDYCEANDLSKRAQKIQARIDKMEMELISFYSERDRDEKPSLSLSREDYGENALGQDGRFSSNPDGF